MQAELELQIAAVIRDVDGSNTMGASALAEHITTALLSRFVLCDPQSIAAINRSSGEVVATLDAAYFGTNWTPLYAPASPFGDGNIGTMRIVAIQGAAEEYARQGNAVIDNQLWDKFGKEGGE
jgi:hypothetical protein